MDNPIGVFYETAWQAAYANARFYLATLEMVSAYTEHFLGMMTVPSRAASAVKEIEVSSFGGHQVIHLKLRGRR